MGAHTEIVLQTEWREMLVLNKYKSNPVEQMIFYHKGSSEGHVKTKEELKKFVLCGLSGERANSKKL